ncbi:hypothetical protein GKC32_00765 [Lactobacillus curvatus]|nr:hypothetical protein [Latilactobacillus curvatus]MSE23006.1 hypothetical protein [Latilactobacillus curvatus]
MNSNYLPLTKYQKEHQKTYNVNIFLPCIYIFLVSITAVNSIWYFNDSNLSIMDGKNTVYYRVIASPKTQSTYYKNVTQNKSIRTEETKLISSSDWQKAPYKSDKHIRKLSNEKLKNYSKIKNTLHEQLNYRKIPTSMLLSFIIDFLFILFSKDKLMKLKWYSQLILISKFITTIPLLFYIFPAILLKIYSNDNMTFYNMFEFNQTITVPAVIIYTIAMLFSLLDILVTNSNKTK